MCLLLQPQQCHIIHTLPPPLYLRPRTALIEREAQPRSHDLELPPTLSRTHRSHQPQLLCITLGELMSPQVLPLVSIPRRGRPLACSTILVCSTLIAHTLTVLRIPVKALNEAPLTLGVTESSRVRPILKLPWSSISNSMETGACFLATFPVSLRSVSVTLAALFFL